MRGLIVAGGLGTRLGYLTQTNNKHLLPIYDMPMIFYPLQTLVKAGIRDIAIVVSGPFAGNVLKVLNNGKDFGLSGVSFFYQEKPDGGIADAIKSAVSFVKNNKVAVILGDNTTDADISVDVKSFDQPDVQGAKIFLKEVLDPQHFGCPAFDKTGKITSVIEKPAAPPSKFAVTGLYLFDELLFYFLNNIVPSERGQLEVTDLLNAYLKMNKLQHTTLNGYWQDAGTYENLLKASAYWAGKKKP